MSISLSFHIIGIVTWLGGLMILTRLLKIWTQPNAASAELTALVRRLFLGFVVPGAVFSLVSGIYQLIYLKGLTYYFKESHWFHLKLTLVVLLLVVTFLVWGQIAKIGKGETLKRAKVGALHGISSTILVVIVFGTMMSR